MIVVNMACGSTNRMCLSSRIEAWDFLKTVAIMLVVYGHLMQYLWSDDVEIYNPLRNFIYSFHMPLFMTLAGLFAMRGFDSSSFIEYCRKRALRILVPCIVWLFIIAGCIMMISGNIDISVFISVLTNGLWFLKSLFICGLLGYMAMKMSGKRWVWVTLTIIVSQFFQKWSVPNMYPCFLLGIMIFRKQDWFKSNWKFVTATSTIIFLAVLIPLLFDSTYWETCSSSISKAATFQDVIIILLCRDLTMFIGMLASISLIVGFYVLFETAAKLPNYIQKMVNAGRYTLGVYVIQTVVVEILMAQYLQLPWMGVRIFWLVNLMIFPIVGVILTWLFAWMTAYVCSNLPIAAMILFGEKVRHKVKPMPVENNTQSK